MCKPNLDSLRRSIVLVGIMGAGKSAIGRRLATRLGLPFVDADHEIATAAGSTIEDIFARYGELEFRKGEERVIKRLLDDGRMVLATGGGAYMNADTRTAIRARGVSIWLRADLDTLIQRVKRRNDRPLLQAGDPGEILSTLIEKRYPVYGKADIVVDSTEGPHELVIKAIVEALESYLEAHPEMMVPDAS